MREGFRFLIGLGAAVVTACGGSQFAAGPSGERDPDDLPYAEAPPPPPPVEPSGWGGKHAGGDAELVAHTDPGEVPELVIASDKTKKLPLEHTHVSAELSGFVAEVEVRQTYQNPHPKPIEVVYVFPLPENSAVHDMRMQIGARVIESEVKERHEARRIYDKAKSDGYTTALLEQERPNVFTQSVANIEPGKKIDVVIRYVQDLTYDAGAYEFVFPMVVGPRYAAGAPDAARISPPIVGKGERTGHDISIDVTANAGLPINDYKVPTHEVSARRPADGSLRLTLADKKSIPNRDFLLRYRVAGAAPKAALYTAGGYFSLVVQPPELDVETLVGRREMIFVVDVSGSMSGTPLAMCKRAMREAISRLRPQDTFDIITFSGNSRRAFEAPRPANDVNIAEAFKIVDELAAGGGTEMLNAVDTALSSAVAPGRHRYVFFLTDGYVGNEDEIIRASDAFVRSLEQKKQRARVFGFGVGSSVNRYLIEGLSRAGKGVSVYATTREDPLRGVNRFYHYVDRAVLTDLKIDWGALGASEIYPKELPDLFASHPLILHGRYRGKLAAPVVIGKVGERTVEVPVVLSKAEATKDDPKRVFGSLWARAKIGSLEQDLADDSGEARSEITRLGIDFHLVTPFTSFIAVDRSRRVAEGAPATIMQPVDEPEGVDVEMAGGQRQEERDLSYGSSAVGGNAPPPAEPALAESGPPHACGCRLPGDQPRSKHSELLLALLMLGIARRRKGRLAPTRAV